ncbi:MAG: hypothetical protein MUW56_05825 [Chryseobacterium sp.]|uniref:hypothetical protein n=1 Tax=Chryseobacterium sp. TaxID=1871047 RepID=UPI0025C377A5|nr:hypothetical protein [Chryseobacterium sp.]MCJ7933152.1 hypothetical protein [Chryseobacterium sp.]
MKIKILTLLLGGMLYAQSGGTGGSNQDKFLPNITPPSPQAGTLGNYGNVPVGLFTGTANISIPLFDYKTSGISLPIHLFYGSNGTKVDDISGSFGLGWNLNFGGVITRTVRDLADESQQGIDIPDSANGGYGNAVAAAFFSLAGSSSADTERDLYSFSYNGNSGKFVFDKNGNPILSDQQKIKIETLSNLQGFIITGADEVKYYFTEVEQTMFRSIGAGHSAPDIYPTAWYLTKIVHPSGDEIYLTYEINNYEYTASESQNMSFSYPVMQVSCGNTIYSKTAEISGIVSHTMRVVGKKISKISSNNPVYGEIRFTYNSATDAELTSGAYNKIVSISQYDKNSNLIDQVNFNYLSTTNNRTFLQGLTFKEPGKTYGFEYINPSVFPARLSRSQDHWGYFNGQNNNNIVPLNLSGYGLENMSYSGANKEPQPSFAKTGMLSKVIYPTKGYTEFDYEGNDYFGTRTIQPPLATEFVEVSGGESQFGVSQEKIINNGVQQYVKITGSASFNPSCPPNSDVGKSKGFLTVTRVEDNTAVQLLVLSQYGTYIPASTNQLLSSQSTYYFNAEPNKTYKVKLATSFECTNSSVAITYRKGLPQTVEENIITGGIRIKSTQDRETGTGNSIYKRYFYAKKNSLQKSSGDKGATPVYYDLKTIRNNCDAGQCIYYDTTDMMVNSSSMLSLFDTGNSNCYYRDVTISEGGDNFENGGETKSFQITRDYIGNQVLGNNTIYSSAWTNFGYNNGQELTSEIFDKTKTPLKQVISEYQLEDAFNKEVKSYAVRKNFELICGNNTLHFCTQYETQNYPANPCYGKSQGTQVYLPDVSNLDVMEYKHISYWNHLKSQTTTEYLNGNPVTSQTEYFYNNPSHYQLTKQKTTTADILPVINETNYSYAHEKGNQLMIDKNMVGILLEKTETQTTGSVAKTIDKTETVYPTLLPTAQAGSFVLPLSVKSYDTLNTTSSTDVTYDKYDDKGNIVQYTEKDGTPVTIIWGYNKTEPIAKIEGMTYDQISALSTTSAIISASNEDATDSTKEGLLLTALNNFRKESTLSGKKITTYTYDPLIGVTSITPSTGIRQIFTYDSAGRLKDGNIRLKNTSGADMIKTVKKNNYHYK